MRIPSSPIRCRASSSLCSTYFMGCRSFLERRAVRSAIVSWSPASSTVLPPAFAGESKARATISPISRTATSCWRVSGGMGRERTPPRRASSIHGAVYPSMNATGRVMVYRNPEVFRCRSTAAFDSKCGIPVSSSADATDARTTWGTWLLAAASIAVVPWRTSFAVSTEKSGLNGVVTMKKPSTPRSAGARLALSVRSPTTPAPPISYTASIFWVLRVRPLTRCLRLTRLLATAPPCCPVAPATKIVFVSAIGTNSPPLSPSRTLLTGYGKRRSPPQSIGPRRDIDESCRGKPPSRLCGAVPPTSEWTTRWSSGFSPTPTPGRCSQSLIETGPISAGGSRGWTRHAPSEIRQGSSAAGESSSAGTTGSKRGSGTAASSSGQSGTTTGIGRSGRRRSDTGSPSPSRGRGSRPARSGPSWITRSGTSVWTVSRSGPRRGTPAVTRLRSALGSPARARCEARSTPRRGRWTRSSTAYSAESGRPRARDLAEKSAGLPARGVSEPDSAAQVPCRRKSSAVPVQVPVVLFGYVLEFPLRPRQGEDLEDGVVRVHLVPDGEPPDRLADGILDRRPVGFHVGHEESVLRLCELGLNDAHARWGL